VKQRESTGDEIVIDKDIFDQMYDVKNPLPDRQDYASLEKYYKNKKIVYNQIQETMNRRYKEKFFKYLNKLDASSPKPVVKEDEWTHINIGEKTKSDLERLYSDYQKYTTDKKQVKSYENVNEYLKQWVLRLIYNDLIITQDYLDESPASFAIDGPETYLSYAKKAIEASGNSGEPVSLPVRKSTHDVLDRLRDITFLETYDQVIIYLLNLVHSRKYQAYLASLEKSDLLPDNFGQCSNRPGDNAGDKGETPADIDHKIRDVDDFIIDYIRLLKMKESNI
jgi:hypothetical protein